MNLRKGSGGGTADSRTCADNNTGSGCGGYYGVEDNATTSALNSNNAVSTAVMNSATGGDFFFNTPLIYSEPALSNLANSAGYTNMVSCAYSEVALPNVSDFF